MSMDVTISVSLSMSIVQLSGVKNQPKILIELLKETDSLPKILSGASKTFYLVLSLV
jgi:hypothetical protein